MDDRSLISVIIIFLNAERFLSEAVESVFGQSYPNWELLLVDDGSMDCGTDLAKDLAERYAGKIRYLEHEGHKNRGMSASRNLGIRNAGGEYIAFLDADDVWLPEKLEEQIAILNAHPEAAMVFGPVLRWYGWTGVNEDRDRDCVVPTGFAQNTLLSPPELLIQMLQKEVVTATVGLLRRTSIAGIGGYEESFRGLYEDQVLSAKLSLHAAIFVEGECRYKWRMHSESSCAVNVHSDVYRRARLTFLQWLESYLTRNRINNAELWEVLQEQLWRCHHWKIYRSIRYMKRAAMKIRTIPYRAARKWMVLRVLPGKHI